MNVFKYSVAMGWRGKLGSEEVMVGGWGMVTEGCICRGRGKEGFNETVGRVGCIYKLKFIVILSNSSVSS